MKPPEEILPTFKKLYFDKEGRPMEPLFYTIRPNFYKLLSVRFFGIRSAELILYLGDQPEDATTGTAA